MCVTIYVCLNDPPIIVTATIRIGQSANDKTIIDRSRLHHICKVEACTTNSYGGGDNDGWIVKTDVNGNTQWSRTVGDAGLQELEAIVLTSDGGYAAIGINYTTGTQYYDILLVKLNSAGVIQWQKNIGGQGYEIGNSIQETADHGFIISGQTYSYGLEDGDTYLAKTDSAGNVEWFKSITYKGIQESHNLVRRYFFATE